MKNYSKIKALCVASMNVVHNTTQSKMKTRNSPYVWNSNGIEKSSVLLLKAVNWPYIPVLEEIIPLNFHEFLRFLKFSYIYWNFVKTSIFSAVSLTFRNLNFPNIRHPEISRNFLKFIPNFPKIPVAHEPFIIKTSSTQWDWAKFSEIISSNITMVKGDKLSRHCLHAKTFPVWRAT